MKEIIMSRIKYYGQRHRGLLLYGEGNCCAIGAFIPPKLEAEVKRSGAVSTEMLDRVPALAPFMPLERDGLAGLLRAHDSAMDDDPREEVCKWIDANVEEAVTV